MIPVRALLAALLAVSTLLGPAGQEAPKEPAKLSPTLESARKRWERFTPEEKERARARYERFLAMSEEEREQLTESARRLRERADRVQGELLGNDGERLSTMEPEKRRALVSDIVDEESRAVGARIRGQLPESLLRRLENARPQDRARFFRQFRIQQRDRVARYAIGELGQRLGLAAQEIARLQELPGDERGEVVLDLRKRLSAQEVDESGLPPGITREQWEAWLALPPEGFFDVFQRYRESRIFSQAKRETETSTSGTEAEEPRKRREALRVLFDAARPHPEEVLALSDLAPDERRAKLGAQRRERCTRALLEGDVLPRQEREVLDHKSDPEFFGIVRRLLWKSVGPLWPRRLGGVLPR